MAIYATLGNVIRIGPPEAPILVTDVNGALVDPQTITVSVHRPDLSITAPMPAIRDALGTFHFDYEPPVSASMVGTHRFRIVTAHPDAAFEDNIYFNPSYFASMA